MANSALIDDLLRQFSENPRRVFARLANEYRKRGELDSAIEICRSHVPLQPGYISGHIVLGQALYDSGSLEEARTTFETALSLDPENLIALRHMGDIARANGQESSARGWYRQLLEIDPQNEDVAAQLQALEANPAAMVGAASQPQDDAAGWGEVNPEAIALASEGEPEESPAPVAAADDLAAESSESPDAMLDDALELLGANEHEATTVEPPVAAAPEERSAVEGLETTAFQSDDASGASPLELVDLDELAPDTGDVADVTMEEAVEEQTVSSAVAPLFAADPFEDSSIDEVESDAATSAFATETMAELYLQQGFPDRALAIYRELSTRSPDDASLRERLRELEDETDAVPATAPATSKAARTAREFFGVLAYRRAPRAATLEAAPTLEVEESAPPVEAAAIAVVEESVPAVAEESVPAVSAVIDESAPLIEEESGAVLASDESAAAVLADAFGETPPGVPAVHNGKPGREAASALSLDDVFRDAPTAEDASRRTGLSFDEFFARRDTGVLPESSNGSVTTEAEATATSEQREHESDDAPHDLELFHAWLDGLKG